MLKNATVLFNRENHNSVSSFCRGASKVIPIDSWSTMSTQREPPHRSKCIPVQFNFD